MENLIDLLEKIEKKYNVKNSYVTPAVRKKSNGIKVVIGGYYCFINQDKNRKTIFNEIAKKVFERIRY